MLSPNDHGQVFASKPREADIIKKQSDTKQGWAIVTCMSSLLLWCAPDCKLLAAALTVHGIAGYMLGYHYAHTQCDLLSRVVWTAMVHGCSAIPLVVFMLTVRWPL